MSNFQNFLRVTSIENDQASNGRRFQKITFNQFSILPNGQEVMTIKTRTRNVWDATEGTNGPIKADPFFGTLQKGSVVTGEIATLNTTPYTIGERTVNQWTGVVFDGEVATNVANNNLRNQDACVVDEHGQPTIMLKKSPARVLDTVGVEDEN